MKELFDSLAFLSIMIDIECAKLKAVRRSNQGLTTSIDKARQYLEYANNYISHLQEGIANAELK